MYRRCILIFGALLILFFHGIYLRPLANPDEGRYAEIGREMLSSGDLVSPRLNGLLYFEKPPLVYWCTALGEKLFGFNGFGARFFNALFAFLTCLYIFIFCRKFFDTKTGLWAASILGTSALFWGMSQMLTIDMALTFFVTVSLLSFCWGFLEDDPKKARNQFLLAYVCVALSVLTKGLIGLIFPALIGIPWLILTKNIRKIFHMHLFKGLLIIILITFFWHYAVGKEHPNFFNFYFWHEHFERYFTSVHNRTKPVYFLFLSFLIGLIPWVAFLPKACLLKSSNTKQQSILLFCKCWILLLIGFFSISKSQLIPYILPALPAASLWLAYGFSKEKWLQKSPLEICLLGTLFLVASLLLPQIIGKKSIVTMPRDLIYGIQIIFITCALGCILFSWHRRKLACTFLAILLACIYLILPSLMPFFQRQTTINISQEILRQDIPSKQVYCIADYFPDLPFYLQGIVNVVDCVHEEHRMGYELEHPQHYTNFENFLNKWKSNLKIFAVVPRNYRRIFESRLQSSSLYLLTQDPQVLLYTNIL